MSHKTAKRARRLAREAGATPEQPGEETHYVEWKPRTRRGVTAERPHQHLMPGSFKSIVKQLKEKLSS